MSVKIGSIRIGRSVVFILLSLSFLVFYQSCKHSSKEENNALRKWTILNPKPQPNSLNSVFFIDNSTGYSVGDFGTIMKTTDGGKTWSLLKSGTKLDLHTIHCRYHGKTCLVAGERGMILKTINGGDSWLTLKSGTIRTLLKIRFNEVQNTYYISGSKSQKSDKDGKSVILMSNDNGDKWVLQEFDKPINIKSIYCSRDASRCFAVGDEHILMTTDGGATWNVDRQWKNNMDYDYILINSLFCSDDLNTCYIVGGGDNEFGYDIYKSIDGGRIWTGQRSSSFLTLESMQCIDASINICYAAGKHVILKTTNGGSTWNTLSTGANGSFNSIHCPENELTCYAVGDGGIILKTTNGGNTWIILSSNYFSSINDISCPIDEECYLSSDNTLFKSIYYKDKWSLEKLHIRESLFNSISCPDASTCYATTKYDPYIVKITDYGHKLNKLEIKIPDPRRLKRKIPDSILLSNYIVGLESIDCPTSSICLAVGQAQGEIGTIIKTTDGGTNWEFAPDAISDNMQSYLTDIQCLEDKNTCFVVGFYETDELPGGIILKTKDGGKSWDKKWLKNMLLYSIYCLDDKETCFSVGSKGIILKTKDGGAIWKKLYSGVTSDLFSVHCQEGGKQCYISGSHGLVLKTSDSGSKWSIDTTNTSNDLFSIYSTSHNIVYAVGQNGTILRK